MMRLKMRMLMLLLCGLLMTRVRVDAALVDVAVVEGVVDDAG
jgi:hypothetical protein